MNADEIRERFGMPAALIDMTKKGGPVEPLQSIAVSNTYQVEALGEIAAQLAELNEHLATLASVVIPSDGKYPAYIQVDADVSGRVQTS